MDATRLVTDLRLAVPAVYEIERAGKTKVCHLLGDVAQAVGLSPQDLLEKYADSFPVERHEGREHIWFASLRYEHGVIGWDFHSTTLEGLRSFEMRMQCPPAFRCSDKKIQSALLQYSKHADHIFVGAMWSEQVLAFCDRGKYASRI